MNVTVVIGAILLFTTFGAGLAFASWDEMKHRKRLSREAGE